jgi:hypothetical protein
MAITTVRDDALLTSTDLVQAGAVFNDSTRLLDGGLWDTPASANNEIAYLGMYTTDIQAVLNDINSMLANPGAVTAGGAALTLAAADTTVLTQVQGQLQTLITLANGSVGTSAAAATNQELLHTTQTSIIAEINGDAALATALANNTYAGGTGADNAGFQALPTGADDAAAIAAATAAAPTLKDIGSVFNAAAALAVGGLNATNITQFDNDMKAIATGLTNLLNNPDALAAVEQGLNAADAANATLHLGTVLDQINLQINRFDPLYATDPNTATRATNDNLLDIIDIIQGDTALNTAAGGNGNAGNVGGFSEMPAYLSGTITRFQDSQAQTDFWAKFVAEGNVINNQLNNVAAGHNTTAGELQALITEIQNYNDFGAAFSKAQGGVFSARFDNELSGGTLLADTQNAIHGLQGIANGDTGDALAADQAQIQAAGAGFVADAGDVSGNNIPLGGGTYVGDATTVAGATSVPGIAHGTIPVAGAADAGGGGAGGGGGGGGGVGNGGGTFAFTTVRDDALVTSSDLQQAGAVFNDAMRMSDGGLWDTPADSNNQKAFLGMYTTDIQAVLNDVTAMLGNPGGVTVGGAALGLAAADTAVLTQVQGQLQTLITLANGSVGTSAAAATNQELLHTTATSILAEINGDATLANALAGATYAGGTGADNVGFQALPVGADDAAALAAASGPNATLADIGKVFNAATALAVGGLNQFNLPQFNADMQAIQTGLTNLVNNPDALAAIEQGLNGVDAATTTLHLDTVLEQIKSQLNSFDAEYAANPNVAARSTSDNLLDIIDIVQGDAALNVAAGGNGTPGNVGGFSEMPAFLSGTVTRFQDDQLQTDFWAKFLAEGNVINNQLNNVAAGHNTTAGELQALVTEIQNYQQFGAAFDHTQGGIFGARFDNELLGGTLNADTNNAVHGLQGILNGDTGAALAADQAQIIAAGAGFVADAQDVSGNNIPIGGGTYVGDATTVAGATSVPGIAHGTIPVAGAADAGGAAGQGTGTGTGTGAGAGTGTGTGGGAGTGTGTGGGQNAGGQGTGDQGNGGNGGQAAGGNNGGHGQGGGCHHSDGDDVPVAQNGAGAGDHHASAPVPTFWTLLESELTQVGVTHQQIQQLEAMWHYA